MAIRQTFDIQFYCRKSKTNKSGLAPVELSIIINGERTYLTLQRKEKPEEFKEAMSAKKTNAIKSFCENQKHLIDDFVEQMTFAGIELTADNLRECLKRGCVAQVYSLGDMWRDILGNEKSKLSTGDLSPLTYRKYTLAQEAFYAANNFKETTPAHSVDIQHINQYQFYLKGTGLEQSTIYNYHARAKSAFTLAFNRGKIKSNPYAGYQMNKGEKKPIVWLTEEELIQIANKDVHIDRLSKVKDMFLFQCYSGLAFSDMALLTKADFKVDKESKQIYVEKRRVKTGELFMSMILKEGKAILEKYNYALPCVSNQKYNAYLKEIQTICGIEKSFHSHLGRTTYVCYLFNKGVSPEVIAKMVGHSTCKTTLRYYAEMDKTTLIKAVQAIDGAQLTEASTSANQPNSVIAKINEYANGTIYKEGSPIPTNQTLVAMEDEIISLLVSLKQDKQTYDEYRVAFAKCCTTIATRANFFRRKIAEEESKGNADNLSKLKQLQKSYKRFSKTMESLDARLFKTCSK